MTVLRGEKIRRKSEANTRRARKSLGGYFGRQSWRTCRTNLPRVHEGKRRNDDKALFQTGRKTSMCAGKLTTDEQSECAERCGRRRVYCEGTLCVRRFDRFFTTSQDEPCKDRQGIWKHNRPHYVKGNGQNVCVITDKPFEETSEEKGEDVRAKRMQVVGERKGSVDTTKEKSKRRCGRDTTRDPESTSTSRSTAAKKATALGQTCFRSVGGGVWLRIVESDTSVAEVDQKRRRGKHDRIKNSSGPSCKREISDVGKYDPRRQHRQIKWT